MWSVVQLGAVGEPGAKHAVPTSRSKHAMCVGQDGFFYMLGGKSANLPMKDLWRFDPVKNQWDEVESRGGTAPPSLQEHTVVSWKSKLYVFGGEIGFASTGETPLWVFDILTGVWRKHVVQGPQPSGRRGHSTVVYNGAMHLYGGYQDLKGSSSELWSFHFDTETWQLVSSKVKGSCGEVPPGRHSHSAVVHDGAMWVYGGMTDLRERNDFWRYDFVNQHWSRIKMPKGTGPKELHSHAAVFANQCMWIFGGEKSGKPSNDLWRYHFATDTWDKIQAEGVLPNPRCRHVALANPQLHKWADKVLDTAPAPGSKVARLPPKSQSMMAFGERSRGGSFKVHPMTRLGLMGCSAAPAAASDEEEGNDQLDAVKAYLAAYKNSNNGSRTLKQRLSTSRLVRSISSGNYNITSMGRQREELERLLEESRHNTPQLPHRLASQAHGHHLHRNHHQQQQQTAADANGVCRREISKSLSSDAVLESESENNTPVHLRNGVQRRSTASTGQQKARPFSEIVASSHQFEVLQQRQEALPLRLSPPPANSRPSRRMHASKSMSFAQRNDDSLTADSLQDQILHQAGFCSTASCQADEGECTKKAEDLEAAEDSPRLRGLAALCAYGDQENADQVEGAEADLRGFSNTAQTTQYGPLTHISDLDSSDTDTADGVDGDAARGDRRREDLLVELRKNTTPLSRSTATELERIRFSSRFTSFSTLSELNNMAISQGRSRMPHSVSHCSGYYSFVEDDPDFQKDIAAFLQPNGQSSPPRNTLASLLLGEDSSKETPIEEARDSLELSTFSTLSDAAAPAIAALKERAKSWDRASQRVLLRGSDPTGNGLRETRLRGLPSRALAIQAIAEESVHGSPIRISSESWSLHNDDEDDEDDDDEVDEEDEVDGGSDVSEVSTEMNAGQAGRGRSKAAQRSFHGGRAGKLTGEALGRLPASKQQVQHPRPDIHNWQLCLYVFGGQEASTPGMYRSPMTVWQLFV